MAVKVASRTAEVELEGRRMRPPEKHGNPVELAVQAVTPTVEMAVLDMAVAVKVASRTAEVELVVPSLIRRF